MLSFKAIAVTLALINVSHAATCEGGSAIACTINDGALPRVSDMWTARQNYCGQNQWQWNSCYRYQNGPATAIFIQNSSPGGNNQQVCWDALENIINQCSSLGQGQAFGYYDYNGVRYRMGGCSNAHVC
ncbi:uncharacterized protein TRIVIDRAFT_68434 [Trichoderma virens Gv29-8]|uniref:Ecp2 effector protein domain-containing protein n=1 Tax=Hypocrea virens (strain Gv29-8 / FGSC 10586) TaxID=413071 RepID=G9N487_HYPVG|nr:uncharacterized protein TRIVIDRAFT_68434 [Trichoderma virens Gv29-8]EHK18413.1 hypothetical protein TRIVIDRAFT_68434 [Trichoderma virens Gv29-8]UKZ52624.1 hypothetical protein TrVGV298_006405 [Trichoderma virens]